MKFVSCRGSCLDRSFYRGASHIENQRYLDSQLKEHQQDLLFNTYGVFFLSFFYLRWVVHHGGGGGGLCTRDSPFFWGVKNGQKTSKKVREAGVTKSAVSGGRGGFSRKKNVGA